MLENLFLLFFDLFLIGGYILGVFILMLFIQLISYRVFRI